MLSVASEISTPCRRQQSSPINPSIYFMKWRVEIMRPSERLCLSVRGRLRLTRVTWHTSHCSWWLSTVLTSGLRATRRVRTDRWPVSGVVLCGIIACPFPVQIKRWWGDHAFLPSPISLLLILTDWFELACSLQEMETGYSRQLRTFTACLD